jgi:hypothetical protein
LFQPQIIDDDDGDDYDDDDDLGAIGGMLIGRESRSTRRKPAPVPLCPPKIPHDLRSNPGRRSG